MSPLLSSDASIDATRQSASGPRPGNSGFGSGSRMLRVAFLLPGNGQNWIGGSNYLGNLLSAVAALPGRTIETVLLVPPDADEADVSARFPADHLVRTPHVLSRHPLRLAGKLCERLTGRNLPLEWLFARHGIDLVSHTPPAGTRPRTPTLSWIADFQERHIPAFFSATQLEERAADHRHAARAAQMIVLSSNDALADLKQVIPEAASKSRVLQFVSSMKAPEIERSSEALRAAYAIDGPFFHLPNQFWIHKNHRVVIDALALLRARGRDVTVICTGHTSDYRHPDFFPSIQAHVAASGVADLFRIEGLVPYADVSAFLRDSVAVINPSLFEGWSTTVEEAKSSGKRILLSDIGVHREQAPERGHYFAPDDAEALATLMLEMLETHDPDADAVSRSRAIAALPARLENFARTYQAIVSEACERRATDTAA